MSNSVTALNPSVARKLSATQLASGVAKISFGVLALAVLSQVRIPLPFTPVPVSLGTFAAIAVGVLLGRRYGSASALTFALLGALGAPIFAGFTAGFTLTFGYVLGYIPAALLGGYAARAARNGSLLAALTWVLAASAVIYLPGLTWLWLASGKSLLATLSLGLAPFIVGDILKAALVVAYLATVARRSH